jgi:hypothetical protein
MYSNKRKQPSQTLYAVTQNVFRSEHDDDECFSYNNEWGTDKVSVFLSKEAARDFIIGEGGQPPVDSKSPLPALYYSCEDFVDEENLCKYQEAFMDTYDAASGTYVCEVPIIKCTIYSIIPLNEGDSVFVARQEASWNDMHDTVNLRLPISLNDTLSTNKYKFRLGYEEEDLEYYVKDLTEKQLAKWRCPIAKPLDGSEQTSKRKLYASYQEIRTFLGLGAESSLSDDEEEYIYKRPKPVHIEPYLVIFTHDNMTEIYNLTDAKRLCETNPEYVQTMLSDCKIVVSREYGISYKDFDGTYVLFHLFGDSCQYFKDTHTWNVIKVTVEDVLKKCDSLLGE